MSSKMRELELESEQETESEDQSDDDVDLCDPEEINASFQPIKLLCEKPIALNKKYVLQLAGTLDTNPNVAAALSDNTCEVYQFSDYQFAKLTVLSEHSNAISNVKFARDNSNLVYTGSIDGSIRLWDLRQSGGSIVQFRDDTSKKLKEITSFDVSSNNILITAGTNIYESDAFILFWDIRHHNLLGGYWESHTDDITQVQFHPDDSNKLISASVDGLINLYDLSQTSEDDALIDSLNTESSVEKVEWLKNPKGKDFIGCVTHTADVQFWKLESAEPFHISRAEIAKKIQRKSEGYVYVVDLYDDIILAGSNYLRGECFRGIKCSGGGLNFSQNQQIVRTSWFNPNINLLLTGGEKGIVDAWRT